MARCGGYSFAGRMGRGSISPPLPQLGTLIRCQRLAGALLRLPPEGTPGLVDGQPPAFPGPRLPPPVVPPFDPPPAFPDPPPVLLVMFLSLLAPLGAGES